jgi:hypothetical protein
MWHGMNVAHQECGGARMWQGKNVTHQECGGGECRASKMWRGRMSHIKTVAGQGREWRIKKIGEARMWSRKNVPWHEYCMSYLASGPR